jgi:hypothetical protein
MEEIAATIDTRGPGRYPALQTGGPANRDNININRSVNGRHNYTRACSDCNVHHTSKASE